jgi:hypothetical protein
MARKKPEFKSPSRQPRNCPECGKLLKGGTGNLNKHIKEVHHGIRETSRFLSRQPRNCPECGKLLGGATSLKENIDAVHRGVQNKTPSRLPRNCSEYGKLIRGVAGPLKNHINAVHRKLRKGPELLCRQPRDCPECGKQIRGGASQLREHIDKVHRGARKCGICGHWFRGIEAGMYPQHLFECREQNSHWLTCDICDRKYKELHGLSSHKESHTLSAQSRTCSECGMVSPNLQALRAHKRALHEGYKKYSVCTRLIKEAIFPQHFLKCQHENSRTCAVCGLKLANAGSPRYHERTIHLGLKQCKVCLKWLDLAAYPQHWLGCQDRAKCPDCGQRFTSGYVLKQQHQKEHQRAMFSCNECGRFLLISELTAHGNCCFNRSDKLAAAICVRTTNCTEKVEFPSMTLCQYHLSEYSLRRIQFIN